MLVVKAKNPLVLSLQNAVRVKGVGMAHIYRLLDICFLRLRSAIHAEIVQKTETYTVCFRIGLKNTLWMFRQSLNSTLLRGSSHVRQWLQAVGSDQDLRHEQLEFPFYLPVPVRVSS